MNRMVVGILAAVAAASAGCANGSRPQVQATTAPSSRPDLPAWRIPRGIVADAIESLGGLTAWRKVTRLSYNAVVTVYDKDGQGHVNHHRQALDMRKWTLTAEAGRPQGSWRAVVGPDGKCSLKAQPNVLSSAARARLAWALPTAKHRLMGPFNLCATGERAGAAKKMRVDGVDVVRVSVEADRRRAAAYYFDAVTGHLRFVTTGDDRPGGRGTVTVYTYRRYTDGMQFPRRVQVFRFGKHALVGLEKVLEVDLKDVKFHRQAGRQSSRPAAGQP